MTNIYMRRSTGQDIDQIMEIIDEAKLLLKNDGSSQWQSGTPNRKTIENDIANKDNWVLLVDGKIAGTTTMLTTPDPNYAKISDGDWLNQTEAYVTMHRVAISSQYRGMHLSKFIFSNLITLAVEHGFKNFRIDTYKLNERMQHLVTELGFQKRGIICVDDEIDPHRLAFELNLK